MTTDTLSHVSQPAVPTTVVQPRRPFWNLELGHLWEYHELLFFMVWRDVKVRYKQTALGVAWAILQPLMATLIFSIFFGRLAKMPSDGVPYPVFAYVAFVPWQYFANALTESSNSLVASQNLIKKVYFPRRVDTPVKHYSSGMYVRLAFAIAAHLEPEILIVDEVLAVGDLAFQQKCLGKMSEVSQAGRTILFVSHNMAVVEKLCQRAILLQDGEYLLPGRHRRSNPPLYAQDAGREPGGGAHVRPQPIDGPPLLCWQIAKASRALHRR